jgi:hypothetical protein
VIDGIKYATNNAVQVDIGLTGVIDQGHLPIPITITTPIPTGISPTDFRILHYMQDGSYEEIVPTVNGDGTCSFTVNHFSVFAFVNLASSFGTNPPTGFADITGSAVAMVVFSVLSVALWCGVLITKRKRNG